MPKRKKMDVDMLRSWTYAATNPELTEARKLLDTAIKARFPTERKRKEKKTAEVKAQ